MHLPLLPAVALVSIVAVGVVPSSAQVFFDSVPEGYLSLAIKPSPDGVTYAITQLSAPLEVQANAAGQTAGTISSVTANALVNLAAGWTADALASAATPCFVKITDGPAAGHLFQITANTTTALMLNSQGLDLPALGIVAGNHYQILKAYTLRSLLGSPAEGIVGGTSAQLSANRVDKALINDANGVIRTYYFDTTASQWQRVGSSASQDNLPIPARFGVTYHRIATTALVFTFTGKVPAVETRMRMPGNGTTILASDFPVPSTLASMGLQAIPSWRKLGTPGVTLNDADRVVAEDAAGISRSYYHDGTTWRRVGSGADQSETVIRAGSAIYCTRFGGVDDLWIHPMPYNLN